MLKMRRFFLILAFFCQITVFSANFEQFKAALATVESNSNPKAYNKAENAIGIYQIRLLYFLDAQSFDKSLTKYSHKDCFNVEISNKVIEVYFLRYGFEDLKNQNWKALAKLHNGGLNWRKKPAGAQKRLEIYWQKVCKALKTNELGRRP